MSVYIAERGPVYIECDMAYTKYKGEEGFYVPCEVKGPVSVECMAKGLGISPRGDCVEADAFKICRGEGGLSITIYLAKSTSRGLTPGEIAKQLLTIADLCARGVIS
ncbi:MAG: hypothetical protein QXP98_05660 [Thermoproteus sp.]